jgi:hypothetical protein
MTSNVPRFDVTSSIQIMVDASVLNTKLGFFSNVNNRWEDASGNENTSISFTSEDLRNVLSVSNDIISIGTLNTIYSDFRAYVQSYFGANSGFETLFAAASEFTIGNNAIFEPDTLINLINGADSGLTRPYTKIMTGFITISSVTISNITQLLESAVNTNCFGNRPLPGSNAIFDISDGFLANDLIWIPNGISITLKLHIDAELFAPINNRGITYGQITNLSNGNFSTTTVASTTLISRVINAPMLIRLK